MMMNDAGERFTHPWPRPVQVHFLPLALHEGYLLRQLAAPCSMAGRRTDKHFQKALERKVSHQVSRDFKIYIEAADYWKRFTTHTNKIGLGKGT